jgi:hypothetical protein
MLARTTPRTHLFFVQGKSVVEIVLVARLLIFLSVHVAVSTAQPL